MMMSSPPVGHRVLLAGSCSRARPPPTPRSSRTAPFQSFAASVRGNGVAFDSKNRVYLTVGTYGILRGQFVTEDGSPVGGTFAIPADGAYTHFPSVSYSPEADGGAGAFLVVWHASDLAGEQTSVHARMVSYTRGGPYGADLQIGADLSWYEAPVNAAYSKVDADVRRRLGQSGRERQRGDPEQGRRASVRRSADRREPATANAGPASPATKRPRSVSCRTPGWTNNSAFVRSVMVNPATGDVVPNDGRGAPSDQRHLADRRRLQRVDRPVRHRVVSGTGQRQLRHPGRGGHRQPDRQRRDLLDAVRVERRRRHGVQRRRPAPRCCVSHDLVSTNNDGGVEIAGSGTPNSTSTVLVVPTTQGNFHPSVAPHATRAEWMAVTSHRFLALFAERITTSASSGGSTPPPPPPTTPPPTTPPPPRRPHAADR